MYVDSDGAGRQNHSLRSFILAPDPATAYALNVGAHLILEHVRYFYVLTILSFSCSARNSFQEDSSLKMDSIETLADKIETCDSIPEDYFLKLQFPFDRLDSIRDTDIDTRKYLQFKTCDNVLFDNTRADIQSYSYISLQKVGDYYSILVYRQMDMENCLFIFSFDKNNKVVDSKMLFCEGGGLERQTDVLINGKIVNTLNEERKAMFTDNNYISIFREFYSLRDTLTNSEVVEIGQQTIITYQLDQSGKFKKISDDSFKREYSNIKYWYN